MKKITLKALQQSINHWIRLRDSKERDFEHPGSGSCALCQLHTVDGKVQCVRIIRGKEERCPVYAQTGKPQCKGGLWKLAYLAYYSTPNPKRTAAMDAEIEFLKSLLPQEPACTDDDHTKSASKRPATS